MSESYTLEVTAEELEALQSLCAVSDLVRVTEKSMPHVASVMAKIYRYQLTPTYHVRR